MKKNYRNLLCLCLAVLLSLTAAFSIGRFALADLGYPTGDLDGDKKVSAADALLILQHAVGKLPQFPIDQEAPSETAPPSDDPIADEEPPNEYHTIESFLADAKNEGTTINTDLVYVPTVPDRFHAAAVHALDERYITYDFIYTPAEPVEGIYVNGMTFSFYADGHNFYGTEPFSAKETAQELAQYERSYQNFSVFELSDGREVLMYGVVSMSNYLSHIDLATTINGRFVLITASITSEDMWESRFNGQVSVWNEYFSDYMEKRAQNELTQLINAFHFEKYNVN